MWFKVDDRFHSSRKVMAIPRRLRLSAVGLWAVAGSWTAGEELDGFVPAYMVDEWGGTDELVDALVASGLWEEAPGGTRFAKWAEWQPTREQLDERREHERVRKAEWRAKKASKRPENVPTGHDGDTPGTDGFVPSNPTRPDPTRPLSTSNEVERALSPFCQKHPNGTDGPCRACGSARLAYQAAEKREKNKPTPVVRKPRTCEVHAEYPLPCDRCAMEAA